MKKYSIILASLLLVLLSSCDKFLDIKPVGKVIPTNVEEYRALLTKAYFAIPTDRGTTNFRSDEMAVRDSDWDLKVYDSQQKWEDNTTLDDAFDYSWQFYYQAIYIANQIVDHKGDIDLTDKTTQADIDQLVGEAYMIRAYLHFILVNLHGQPYTKPGAPETKAVPLVLDTNTEAKRNRNRVSTIYKAILSDIERARNLINKDKWDVLFSYRFNKASVDAFETRVNLYMGKWEQAYEAAKRVLVADYQLVNLNQEEAKVPNHFQSTENIAAAEMVMSNNVTRAAVVTEACQAWYNEADDKRFQSYFNVEEETETNEQGETVVVSRKVTSKKSGYNQFKTAFRLGEVVITAAETAAHLNLLDEAKGYIKQLAAKRYTEEGFNRISNEITSMNKEQLIEFIGQERARELAFEGHRWFDLRRTTRPEIVKVLGGETFTLTNDDPRYTIPIPREAVRANPNLAN